ncbi:MAG: hypothetical protein OHK0019_11730 [Saprospiraceae bacterium]
MKKIASTLCFLIIAVFSLSAQDGPGFRFGIQVSPTWSWLRNSDKRLEPTGSNWGLKFGMLGEYYFAPNYAFISGLGFSFNQGGNIQNGYETADLWNDSPLSDNRYHAIPRDGKFHYRLTYVEIPLGLKLRGSSSETMSYYVEIPVFTLGFLTRAQGDIRGTPDEFLTEDEDIRDDVNGLSLAWGLGGGIEYKVSNFNLFVGLHFQQQFTDMTDKGLVQKTATDPFPPSIEDKSKANINLISLRAGVFF